MVCVHGRVTDRVCVCAGPWGEGSQNQLQCSQRRPLFHREPHKSQRSSAEEGSKSWGTIYLNFLHSATPRGRRHTQQLLSQLFSGDPPSALGLIWSVVIYSLLALGFLAPCGHRNFWFPLGSCDYNVQMYCTRSQLQTFLSGHFEFEYIKISGLPSVLVCFSFLLLLFLQKLVKRKRDAFGHLYWTFKSLPDSTLLNVYGLKEHTVSFIQQKRDLLPLISLYALKGKHPLRCSYI